MLDFGVDTGVASEMEAETPGPLGAVGVETAPPSPWMRLALETETIVGDGSIESGFEEFSLQIMEG